MKIQWIALSAALTLGLIFSKPTVAQVNIDDQIGLINTINTAVPFLRITPDGRAGGMGDVGVASSPDAPSIYWNPAKTAFLDNNFGVHLTYTPWLKQLVNDIYLAYLAAYWKLDDLQTIHTSMRYFSLGNIVFTDISGNEVGQGRPNEFAFDVGYSRKLSKSLSTGINLRYIYSNLASNQIVSGVEITPGNGFAADLAVYQTNSIKVAKEYDTKLDWGISITNIGTKISYTESADNKDYLPTNLGIGTSYEFNFDDYNKLTLLFDVNKLLVPTPNDTLDADGNGILDYKEFAPISGIFSSFTDAPGGFSEELHELMYSVGIEYWYDNQFAIRAGHFNEHSTKGNRKYFSVGLGLKYNIFGLDFAYLIPTSNQRNPLDNTLRFSLTFDFNDLKGQTQDSGSGS